MKSLPMACSTTSTSTFTVGPSWSKPSNTRDEAARCNPSMYTSATSRSAEFCPRTRKGHQMELYTL